MKQEIIMNITEKRSVDLLVSEFWRLGFFTLSRRLGIFLPEPENIGKFSVDVIGRQKEKYALGITLTNEDIFNPNLIEKINYLASRKTKSSDRSIVLIIGVPDLYLKQVREILRSVDNKLKKNIKLTRILEEHIKSQKVNKKNQQIIFS